ncbi:MAG: hypothetical protein KME21_30725 [Desmonostoc vinosum HA7617-LM4]|jgi:hypothetical protein|nr:hypothetical protein [Desmonostoc vinosum HA7617-LM4]
MDNLNASQVSPEIEYFKQILTEGRGFGEITEIIQQEVQRQVETELINFQQAVAQSNLSAIEVMSEEINRIKQDSATVKGVMERLVSAVAPDLPQGNDEVVSFREAIDNLEKYGSIIPSSSDIIAAQLRVKKNQAWSLVWQSLAKLLVVQLQKLLDKKQQRNQPKSRNSKPEVLSQTEYPYENKD